MTRHSPIFAFLILVAGVCSAQTDSVPLDTLEQTPSNQPVPGGIEDSIRMVFPNVLLDTLSEAQRLLIEFDTRYRLRKQEEPAAATPSRFSFLDSLTAYYLPGRWNLREDIDRSFFHDAGDYFRSDPSYFVLEPQEMPMRKTVQPFGLAGDRLGLLSGGRSYHPFEHVVEPDGLVDLNDLPTAPDQVVAVLPGPVGLIFGADHSAASLLTLPLTPDSTNPRSSFIVDKGNYAYSHARGKYTRKFVDGRRVDMSLGYRNSDGLVTGTGDDAYFYTGNLLFPVGDNWELEADGQLYDRTGVYQIRHFARAAALERDRIDRSGGIRISRYNGRRDSKYSFRYSHLRQGSALNGNYDRNLNQTGNGLALSREWLDFGFALRAEVSGDHLEYDDWSNRYTRMSAAAQLQLARLTRPWGLSAVLRQVHVEDYGFLPAAAFMVRREGEKALLAISAGYSERAPSMNELHLPYLEARLYESANDYADRGNPNLVSEKMLHGSLQASLGRPDNSLTVTVTGGQIRDGIDWVHERDGGTTLFSPRNGDVDFAAVTAVGRLRLADFLRLKSGASYNQAEYEVVADRAYAPEYLAFSGMELHLLWRQKLIDLYAYGELAYVGPYDGYVQADLGDRVVANLKFSFRTGHFRFHWIMQNALSNYDSPRDWWRSLGWVNYYGFTWDFLD